MDSLDTLYPPWYMGDNPRDDVRWVRVPFNAALNTGPKSIDINLSSSPSPKNVGALSTSPAANVGDLGGLRSLKLGVQVGTTSCVTA
jgi:polar amino acid transport system substrate-binding protein